MKLLNYIFDKANLFVVFISMFILCSIVVSLFVLFLSNPTQNNDMIILLLKVMIVVITLMSFLFTMIVRESRLNEKFRSQLTVVSDSITNVTTIVELENIRDVDIIELKKLVTHTNHIIEIKNLNSLIDLKIDTIKKLTI